MRVLHITHHNGCKLSIDFVCMELGHDIETQFADWNYNMSAKLADELWHRYKDYYNGFDAIITSDTASIARIFLQNNYMGKLIIWVCNRFDYSDGATNDCEFPDPDFYKLFDDAKTKTNVKIHSYTKFEHEYALKYRDITWGEEVIRPCRPIHEKVSISAIPADIDRSKVFLITRYHNDNIFMDLKAKCDDLGIYSYRGEYNGPSDLVGIRGIIHIPYAWSNLALFENWSIGNVYLIPSKKFLLELSNQPNFFWSPPFDKAFIESSEWYLPEHMHMMIYFDSFEDLQKKAADDDLILRKKQLALDFSKEHTERTLKQWSKLL